MFLTNPTREELEQLDVETLTAMLAQQTAFFVDVLTEEGSSQRAHAQKELIARIQEVVSAKKTVENSTHASDRSISA